MPSSKQLFHHIRHELDPALPEAEREAMAFLVLDHFGISTNDVLTGREVLESLREQIEDIIRRVNAGEPVQYVLGYAWFHGLRFGVNPSVLIPRPETEWLAAHALASFDPQQPVSILDLGTGSGAIAVAIARARPAWKVTATDVSAEALHVATINARDNSAGVHFLKQDMRSGEVPPGGPFDMIVSNPPYIPLSESTSLPRNVAGHEPHTALFTSDPEGLEFFKAIAGIAAAGLVQGGLLAVEIHEQSGPAVADLFSAAGLDAVQIVRDDFGKQRYVTSQRN